MPLKMIIAEDDLKVCAFISEQIAWWECGIEVVGVAQNGMDLVKLCGQMKPDICIVDIGMPLMGGLEAIELIKPFLCDTKIIILSGSEEFDHARRAISIGAVAYLLKPVDEELVIATVNRVKEMILKERETAEILKFANEWVKTERPQMFASFIKKWTQQQCTDEEIRFCLDSLHLNKNRTYLFILIDHPDFQLAATPMTHPEERTAALQRSVQRVLKLKNEILWVSLTPRRLFGIVVPGVYEAVQPINSNEIQSILEKTGAKFHMVSQTVSSIIEEFHHTYIALTEKLELEMNESPIIKAVEQIIINEYMKKDLNLLQISQRKKINHQYLSRIFKSETGLSFTEFLIQTRISKAMEMMDSTNASIHDIADYVGYSSHQYFTSAFRKITGLTPTEYKACKSTFRQ